MNILTTVKTGLTIAKDWTVKHSPEILLVTGIGAGVGATVSGCVAVKKMEAINAKHKELLDSIRNQYDNYEAPEYKRAVTKEYGRYGLEVGKTWAPCVGFTALSITSSLASFKIINGRLIASEAAFTGLSKFVEQYRENVIEDQGEEKDLYYANNGALKKKAELEKAGKYKAKEFKPGELVKKQEEALDPNAGYWTCTNCGTLLTDPDDPDMDTPSGATWFCDCCGACLNKQYGFDENYSSWTCTECGHINNLSGDDIYSSEEEYQNSITHYNCPSCGAELNKQPSFYEEDEYTCESCGEELYKDGGEYVKKYTCPHCGATLNSQWGFNTWSNYFSCSNCGSQLYKSGDEYEEEQQDQNEVDSADGYDESDEDTYEEDDESDDDDFSSRQTTSQFRDVNTSAEHEDFS